MKKFIGTLFVASLFLAVTATTTFAEEVTPADETPEIILFKDITGLRYKTENGVLYKRLYNYSTNTWIGNWQRV